MALKLLHSGPCGVGRPWNSTPRIKSHATRDPHKHLRSTRTLEQSRLSIADASTVEHTSHVAQLSHNYAGTYVRDDRCSVERVQEMLLKGSKQTECLCCGGVVKVRAMYGDLENRGSHGGLKYYVSSLFPLLSLIELLRVIRYTRLALASSHCRSG